MGDLSLQNPVATSRILIANMALCGLPFLAGFYSKDLIIEYMLTGGFNLLILNLTFVAVGFTALYSIRFTLLIIWGPSNHLPLFRANEKPCTSTPIILISCISVIAGACLLWLIPIQEVPFYIPLSYKLTPISMVCLGILIRCLITLTVTVKQAKILSIHITHYASSII